jgi:hypothetical protein
MRPPAPPPQIGDNCAVSNKVWVIGARIRTPKMVPSVDNLSHTLVKELNWRCRACGENHLRVGCTTRPVMGDGNHYRSLNVLARKIISNRNRQAAT